MAVVGGNAFDVRAAARQQQRERVRRDTFTATDTAQALGGRRLDPDAIGGDAQIGGNRRAHGVDMRGHSGRLGDDGDIRVGEAIAARAHHSRGAAQQFAAVDILVRRVRIGKVRADIAGRRGAEQGVAERVEHDIAVGMGEQTAFIRNRHAAEHQPRAGVRLAKGMHVVTVADTHHGPAPDSAAGASELATRPWRRSQNSARAKSSG